MFKLFLSTMMVILKQLMYVTHVAWVWKNLQLLWSIHS